MWRSDNTAPVFFSLFVFFMFSKVDRCGSCAVSNRQRLRSGNRLVNPDLAGKSRWLGSTSYEALRVKLVGRIEYILAAPQNVFRLSIVNRGWRQQAYAGVTVFFVIPTKKTLTERTTVLDAPKTVRELRPILHRSELALGEGIVVRDVRPPMRFGNTEIGEQKGYWLGPHRGATIGVQRELIGLDVLFLAAILDQPLGQFRAFTISDHPAGNVTTEDIEDRVQVEIRPFRGTE